jgi:membrane protein
VTSAKSTKSTNDAASATSRSQRPSSAETELSLARVTIIPPYPTLPEQASFADRIKAFATWVQATRPMRVVKHWSERRGGTLASGMAYSALFSVFAALLVFFSVLGLVVGSNKELMNSLITSLSDMVPGLIDTGGGSGVVKAEDLLSLDAGSSFTIAGIIALASTLWTAMNFLNGSRLAIRAMFDLPAAPERSMAVTRLTDLGLMVAGALMLILAAGVVAAGSGLANWLIRDVFGLNLGVAGGVMIQLAGMAVTLAVYTTVVAAMLRVLAQIRIPGKTLWSGALIGGVAIGILTYLGSALLGGATSNPLIATFATILGVLIFFNFLCMVLLITASWVKVTMDDLGQAPRVLSLEEAERLTHQAELEARRDRLATTRLRIENEMEQLPRWRRRKVRREYEAVIGEQVATENEIRTLRMGYDPLEAKAEREGIDEDDITLRR